MSWFKAEVFVLYFVIVFDLLNGMFFTTTNQIEIAFMFFGITLGLLAFFLIVLSHMLMRTFLFEYGLLGMLLKEFKIFSMTLLYAISFLVAGLMRLNYIGSNEDTPQNIWYSPLYVSVFIIHRLLGVLFYFYTLTTTFRLGDPSLYKPSPEWQDRIRQHLIAR